MLCFYSISTTIFKFVSFLIFALFLLLVTTDKAFEAAGIPREFYARSWHISNSLFLLYFLLLDAGQQSVFTNRIDRTYRSHAG